jgi:hypothetical protein
VVLGCSRDKIESSLSKMPAQKRIQFISHFWTELLIPQLDLDKLTCATVFTQSETKRATAKPKAVKKAVKKTRATKTKGVEKVVKKTRTKTKAVKKIRSIKKK